MRRSKDTGTGTRDVEDVFDWCLEHVRPSVSFDDPTAEDAYIREHGDPDSVADLFDYVKDNATFKVGLTFAF